MIKIEVFGTGCPSCKKTEAHIKNIVAELDLDAEIVKVEDMDEITERGVMLTPAVAVDGEMKVSGKVPSETEILKWFE
ncbi:MAG: thioredoxin family protein [Bacillota bacterium]